MRNLLLLLVLVIGLFPITIGCEVMPLVGVAANVYIAWVEGEAHAYYAADSKTAYNAVKRALRSLDYPITTDEDQGEGQYHIIADSGSRFRINIKQVEPYVTKISIRINIMGDKPYAELIYEHLEHELDVIDYTKYQPSN